MPSCKPEATNRFFQVGAQFAIARFSTLVGFTLASSGKRQDRIQRDDSRPRPFLSLRLFNFLRHFDLPYSSRMPESSAREAPDGAIDRRTVHHLAVQETTPGLRERRLRQPYDAAGVIHFFLGRCVEVVQQINPDAQVDQRLPSRSCFTPPVAPKI